MGRDFFCIHTDRSEEEIAAEHGENVPPYNRNESNIDQHGSYAVLLSRRVRRARDCHGVATGRIEKVIALDSSNILSRVRTRESREGRGGVETPPRTAPGRPGTTGLPTKEPGDCGVAGTGSTCSQFRNRRHKL